MRAGSCTPRTSAILPLYTKAPVLLARTSRPVRHRIRVFIHFPAQSVASVWRRIRRGEAVRRPTGWSSMRVCGCLVEPSPSCSIFEKASSCCGSGQRHRCSRGTWKPPRLSNQAVARDSGSIEQSMLGSELAVFPGHNFCGCPGPELVWGSWLLGTPTDKLVIFASFFCDFCNQSRTYHIRPVLGPGQLEHQ